MAYLPPLKFLAAPRAMETSWFTPAHSDSKNDVLEHVANWLRGRPRWTATFVEIYLLRSGKTKNDHPPWSKLSDDDRRLMGSLDSYLKVMTCDSKTSKRLESWNPGETSAYSSISKVMMKRNDETGFKLRQNLGRAVSKYAVGMRPMIIDDPTALELIQRGIAYVEKMDEEGDAVSCRINEPIIVQASLNNFSLDGESRQNLAAQEDGGLGTAFERLLIPPLLEEEDFLLTIVANQVKGAGNQLEGFSVPKKSSYGVLALDASGKADAEGEVDDDVNVVLSEEEKNKAIKETLDWIEKSILARFDGQVPPFCFPDTSIGPDILFLMRNLSYTDFRAAVIQGKYANSVYQNGALMTLTPTKFYQENRGKSNEKLSPKLSELEEKFKKLLPELVSSERPCLRVLVQMPADTTRAAAPGMIASDKHTTRGQGEKRDFFDYNY